MDLRDAKKLFLDNPDEDQKVVRADTKPTGSIRPSDYLVSFHLHETARLANLGVERRDKVAAGTIDLYNRLKPRDAVDSIYCLSIVAALNASMKSYNEAAFSNRGENLDRAYEGTALLMDLITTRENRRALLEDRNRREAVLEELVKRYALASPAGKEK